MGGKISATADGTLISAYVVNSKSPVGSALSSSGLGRSDNKLYFSVYLQGVVFNVGVVVDPYPVRVVMYRAERPQRRKSAKQCKSGNKYEGSLSDQRDQDHLREGLFCPLSPVPVPVCV